MDHWGLLRRGCGDGSGVSGRRRGAASAGAADTRRLARAAVAVN